MVNYRLLQGIAEFPFEILDFNKPLMVDFETKGFFGKICLAQFYQEGWEAVILIKFPKTSELTMMLSRCWVVAFSASYEVSSLQRNMGNAYWCPDRLDDAMFLARLHFFDKIEGYTLDTCIRYATNYDPYLDLGMTKKELQKSNWDVDELTEDQLQYAAFDVFYMQQLWDVVKVQLSNPNYVLDILTLRSNLRFQCNGMPVDSEKLEALSAQLAVDRARIQCPVNSKSNPQVRERLGEAHYEDYPKGFNAFKLRKMIWFDHADAKLIYEDRHIRTIESEINVYRSHGERVHGIFNPSASTGRSRCSEENLQKVNRSLRCLFGYPQGSDRILCYSDFSQLEMRTVCALIADRTMEEMFRAGVDLHTATTSRMFNVSEPTKDQRQLGKICNFSLLYFAGATVLQKIFCEDWGIYKTIAECKELIRMWKNAFPSISTWHESARQDQEQGIIWGTAMGRMLASGNVNEKLSYRVQGTGAEVAKLANHYMELGFEEAQLPNWQGYQIQFGHDSFLMDFPNDPYIYQTASKIIADSMQKAWFAIIANSPIPDLPMPVEVLVGSNWGDLEAGKSEWSMSQ